MSLFQIRDEEIGLRALVIAFMALSLVLAAFGASRFTVAMGFPSWVGFLVGGLFDFTKGPMLRRVLPLWSRRRRPLAAIFAVAGSFLLTFSCLATHGTVSMVFGTIERAGTWKMEVRGNSKLELNELETRLAARPAPRRSGKAVGDALAAERVPPDVWKDSEECIKIRQSAYFAAACAKFVKLRGEVAAALEYEQLSARIADLRKRLAETPLLATSDPLPAAFEATLGRFLPLSGTAGIALLVTMVIELISSFGLDGVRALARDHQPCTAGSLAGAEVETSPGKGDFKPIAQQAPSRSRRATSSLKAIPARHTSGLGATSGEESHPPSVVLPLTRRIPSLLPEGASLPNQPGGGSRSLESHVATFVRERLRKIEGTSIASSELRSAYEVWCAERAERPLSVQGFAAEMIALGYEKYKSCGLMRYRGLQLVA